MPQRALPCWYRAVSSVCCPAPAPGNRHPFEARLEHFPSCVVFLQTATFLLLVPGVGLRVSSEQPVRRYRRHKNSTSPTRGAARTSSILSAELRYPAASTICWSNLSSDQNGAAQPRQTQAKNACIPAEQHFCETPTHLRKISF